MHSQVLVIYQKDVELADVMHPYQEIDKTTQGKINDERCQFSLQVKEEDIPDLLKEIEEYTIKKTEAYLEMMQYRAKHTIKQVEEKYGYVCDFYDLYKLYMDDLIEYKKIRDLPFDDVRQIAFIKNTYDSVRCGWVDTYIKGIGYGTFHNPYELWDYYQDASRRLGNPLLVNYDGEKSDKMAFNELDITATLDNIKESTYVWDHIIFCHDDPNNSRLFTKDNWEYIQDDCRIADDGLEDTLKELTGFKNKNYTVSAVDMHR